jgi:uncharacterized protein
MLEFAMLFNVSGLMQEGIGATRTHEVEGVLRTDGREPEQVSGNVEMLRTKDGILVRSHLNLVEPEICSRCLQPLQETLSIEFEEEFLATVDVQSGRPLDERPDDDAFVVDQNHMLDLTEAVRQYREASAEMQPLCREDCKGLCPNCGQDLNSGECTCNAAPIDTRWADLAGLLPESGSSSEGKE